MNQYKKIIYIILASVILVTLVFILIIHTFNNVPDSGHEEKQVTTAAINAGC